MTLTKLHDDETCCECDDENCTDCITQDKIECCGEIATSTLIFKEKPFKDMRPVECFIILCGPCLQAWLLRKDIQIVGVNACE